MPEGPEVRRHADMLAAALTLHPLVSLTARTKAAKAWLAERPGLLEGRRVESVRSHGKNLVGLIEGGYYFYSHLMMWGRWHVFTRDAPLEVDRRERARIVVPDATAILFSAPVFEIGQGDPSQEVEFLRYLGPDTLPYPGDGPFDVPCFQARLLAPPHRERTVGAALLDQAILAGIGNYLRAEILFACRLDPWRLVRDLTPGELDCLSGTIPDVVGRAYATGGVTVPDDAQARMRTEPGLAYNPDSEWGTRHWVFRRTNLPCLVCGGPIRQKRQMTRQDEDGEKERITYFCPVCQRTTVPLGPVRKKSPHPPPLPRSGRGEPDKREEPEVSPDLTPLPLAKALLGWGGVGAARRGWGSMTAFLIFAQTAEQIGATTKRLEKAAVLGRYFGSLSDEDLRYAARYFAGYTFPLRDQRTTNVGGAALLAAIMAVSGADETTVRERLVALGDAGDVAREVFAASPQVALTPTLTLPRIAAFLETLAALSGTKRKVELVTGLLREATPLEAKYVVKLLAGDLRIGLKEGAVEDAVARLAGVTVGQVQWVNMLEGDIGETALLARRGRLGEARMQLFHPLKFMLATPAADLADVARQMPVPFVVEDKFDGIRAQVHIAPHVEGDGVLHGVVCEGHRVAIFSRTLDEITQSFPDLIAPLAALLSDLIPLPLAGEGSVRSTGGGGLILDGEIIPVQGDLTLPFLELQKRLGRKTLTDALRAEVPVAFVAYDVLYAEGRVLIEEPFCARRAILETLPIAGGGVRRAASELFTGTSALDAAFDAARARGNEGLMVKDPTSPYKPGRRGRDWLKIKRALATLDVVITAAQVGEGRRSKFLSDYTFAVRTSETDPTLLNVGKAYSGLTDAETQELSDWCRAHTLQEFAHGKVRTVEPLVVLEVTFDRVQVSSRHKSGYALRFPRILRLRPDKPAGEIDALETVKRLAEAEGGISDDA